MKEINNKRHKASQKFIPPPLSVSFPVIIEKLFQHVFWMGKLTRILSNFLKDVCVYVKWVLLQNQETLEYICTRH